MGAGKTVVGRALAARNGWPHVDTDEVLAARHGPVGDQVRADPVGFRAREDALIRELAATPGLRVVSTGGGVVEAGGALEVLLGTHRVVFLDAPLEVLAGRVAGTDRPLWDGAVAERWARRRERWALAHVRVDASGPVRRVVERAARAAAPADFVHAGADGPCPVVVAAGWGDLCATVDAVAPGRRLLVTDDHVDACWGAEARANLRPDEVLVTPSGEANKTLDAWRALVDGLLAARVTRDTTVFAFGGGVVGDLAGFAAASALRGVPVVQLPTTLLAMVDAALGGKTGVDHASGKNLVGAFHPPAAVGAMPAWLATLPPRELRSGLAEVAKTALVADAPLFEALESGGHVDAAVVQRCLAAKARVVEADPYDDGVRLWLNAGHTVGHALERVAGYGVYTHGEAVAVGLVAEAEFAVASGVCVDPELPGRLRALLTAVGLPTRCPEVDASALVAAAQVDKKASADTIRLPLPVRVGEMSLVDVPRQNLLQVVAGALR